MYKKINNDILNISSYLQATDNKNKKVIEVLFKKNNENNVKMDILLLKYTKITIKL